MKKYVLPVLAVTLFSGPVPANVETRVLIGKRGGNKLPYKLSLPDDHAKNKNKNENENEKEYPVLVYLHGAAENGTDLKAVGIPGGAEGTCERWYERFILIAPNVPLRSVGPHRIVRV